ncbi:MAG: ribosome maturation factor RimP [Ruminococcaceae bacterium]|nr:ribosome maturation factor RimP [Oscillospiraceae bacterium]MBR3596774.1 ribosome maturation factor RimP [Clostridia bacterium]
MAEKRKGGNVVNAVWDIAAPLADGLGLMLWDVKFVKEGANWYLRVIIDKEEGISIDDCVAMNDALDAPLDEADPIEQSYNLQVSSPGIERELVRDFHFERYLGSDVIVKFRSAVDGVKLHKCVLAGYTDGNVTLRFPDSTERTFDKKDTSSIKLDDFDSNF